MSTIFQDIKDWKESSFYFFQSNGVRVIKMCGKPISPRFVAHRVFFSKTNFQEFPTEAMDLGIVPA